MASWRLYRRAALPSTRGTTHIATHRANPSPHGAPQRVHSSPSRSLLPLQRPPSHLYRSQPNAYCAHAYLAPLLPQSLALSLPYPSAASPLIRPCRVLPPQPPVATFPSPTVLPRVESHLSSNSTSSQPHRAAKALHQVTRACAPLLNPVQEQRQSPAQHKVVRNTKAHQHPQHPLHQLRALFRGGGPGGAARRRKPDVQP